MAKFTSKTGSTDPALYGLSGGEGVHGESTAIDFIAGVSGLAANTNGVGPGVLGRSNGSGPGVVGLSNKDNGVLGFSGDPRLQEIVMPLEGGKAGVFGASENAAGVFGYARNKEMPAVCAYGGLLAFALGREFAAVFQGDVKVVGDVLLAGADCAEQFDVVETSGAQPGSVVVIGSDGALCQSTQPYDTKVAGVVSGAGTYRPGIILDKQLSSAGRLSVSLMGKVFCKVDSRYGPVEVGDLLTTSSTPGHAMKACDSQRAFGAILGKALKPWNGGIGLIPILIALG
ncbi:hypothetical protein [Paraburkholderia sp. 22B1P]|uniref:hypothetical protein n=1 Tax=Paraburkholderia sp. 22B1P TaxID=3080498 RepID=UPI00308A2222|nr:hypothetical protein PBP221_81800 [Paraburkholderia sp. 22B1P]